MLCRNVSLKNVCLGCISFSRSVSCNYANQEEINGRLSDMQWTPVIGLEIHAQINSKSKLFSGMRNKFMSPPNTLVSNFDASMPGTLPAINKECVRKAVSTGLSLNCTINKRSYFDRKHYFYADMPQGYQITQYRHPIAVNGYVEYPTNSGNSRKKINIEQIQLEQDSGKSLHEEGVMSLIDLNRAGVGLMEIVTAPDLESSGDTYSFLKELYLILKRINVCDGKLAEGQFRVDVNLSMRQLNGPFGTRAEVKNINGFKHIHSVVEYEIKRQMDILKQGGIIEAETRAFDYENGVTIPMRDKEVIQDYRFLPEPNLPPLCVYDDITVASLPKPWKGINVDEEKRNLPKLPSEIRHQLMAENCLTFKQAEFLLEREMEDYFIEVMSHAPQLASVTLWNWLRVHMVSHLLECNLDSMKDCLITAKDLAQLLLMKHNSEINEETALKVFVEATKTQKSPAQIVEENNWKMISDQLSVTKLCQDAIEYLEDADNMTFSKYNVLKPKSKTNKKAINKVIMLVRDYTNEKIHTGVAKDITIKLLDNKLRS